MLHQNPTGSDSTFIIINLLVAMVVFIILLIVAAVSILSVVGTRDELKLRLLAGKLGTLLPGTRIRKTLESLQRAIAHVSSRLEKANPQRDAIVVLVLLLGLLLGVGLATRSALNRGWSAYTNTDPVSFLTVDRQGRVWAVTQGSVLRFADDGEILRTPLPDFTDLAEELMVSDSVSSLAVDMQDRLWVGTLTSRIAIHDSGVGWTLYYPQDFGEPFEGLGIWIDGQGQAWATGPKPARIHLDVDRKIYTLESSGLDNIEATATDEQGRLWMLGTSGELKVLAPDDEWRTYSYAIVEDPEAQYSEGWGYTRLVIDGQGQVWIGTGNGKVQVLGLDGHWRSYTPDDPHPAIRYVTIVVDDQGQMWGVTGYLGIYRFNPDTGWTAYNTRNSGLSGGTMTSLAIDKRGWMWILTEGGLNIFDPDAALPVKYVPALSFLGIFILPAALLSLALLTVWTVIYGRPGMARTGIPSDFPAVPLGTFGATLLGLYALQHRRLLADQIMDIVFGASWAFNDVFQFFLFPPLSICLIPVSVIVGATMGILFSRLFVRLFARKRSPQKNSQESET